MVSLRLSLSSPVGCAIIRFGGLRSYRLALPNANDLSDVRQSLGTYRISTFFGDASNSGIGFPSGRLLSLSNSVQNSYRLLQLFFVGSVDFFGGCVLQECDNFYGMSGPFR
jgi:hypothetical protein